MRMQAQLQRDALSKETPTQHGAHVPPGSDAIIQRQEFAIDTTICFLFSKLRFPSHFIPLPTWTSNDG